MTPLNFIFVFVLLVESSVGLTRSLGNAVPAVSSNSVYFAAANPKIQQARLVRNVPMVTSGAPVYATIDELRSASAKAVPLTSQGLSSPRFCGSLPSKYNDEVHTAPIQIPVPVPVPVPEYHPVPQYQPPPVQTYQQVHVPVQQYQVEEYQVHTTPVQQYHVEEYQVHTVPAPQYHSVSIPVKQYQSYQSYGKPYCKSANEDSLDASASLSSWKSSMDTSNYGIQTLQQNNLGDSSSWMGRIAPSGGFYAQYQPKSAELSTSELLNKQLAETGRSAYAEMYQKSAQASEINRNAQIFGDGRSAYIADVPQMNREAYITADGRSTNIADVPQINRNAQYFGDGRSANIIEIPSFHRNAQYYDDGRSAYATVAYAPELNRNAQNQADGRYAELYQKSAMVPEFSKSAYAFATPDVSRNAQSQYLADGKSAYAELYQKSALVPEFNRNAQYFADGKSAYAEYQKSAMYPDLNRNAQHMFDRKAAYNMYVPEYGRSAQFQADGKSAYADLYQKSAIVPEMNRNSQYSADGKAAYVDLYQKSAIAPELNRNAQYQMDGKAASAGKNAAATEIKSATEGH